jgi:hypothetical protein
MKELDDIGPELGELGKKKPFVVPEGYFETFSARLHERMGMIEKPVRIGAGRKILRPALAYITGFSLLLIIGFAITRIALSPHSPKASTEASMANLVLYSLENIDEQTIIEALPKADQDSASSEITGEDVIKYIQDHNIDLNSLNDEL